jgi:D-alanyl-lipoteichoic acid acyltransferase DltB (MBOAT superfamily)
MTFVCFPFALLLAITLPLYYVLPQRRRMVLLTLASYVFYAWWNPIYAMLILGATVVHYAAALGIQRSESPAARRGLLALAVVTSLALLGYFKYTNFALDTLRALLSPWSTAVPGPFDIVLPAGISFYTFQILSYTLDVYRRDIRAERDFLAVALFVSFFPQLVAGPIERTRDLLPQLRDRRTFRWADMETGVRIFLWGMLKKFIADRISFATMPAYADPSAFTTGQLVFSAVGMMVVIYLDFSAYSDMATGTASWFGVRLTRNFAYPQAAGNVAEYWRRWHISMSTWVRDYLFMPLGGFRPRNTAHHARIMLITMGLVGLWHGANWTYVLWGLGHGVTLVGYHLLHLRVLRNSRRSAWRRGLPWRFGSWLLTAFIRCVLSVLFFSPDLQRSAVFLNRMLLHPTAAGFSLPHVQLGLAFAAAFWVFHYLQATRPMTAWWGQRAPLARGAAYAMLVWVIGMLAVSRADSFIYFQF